MCVYIAEGMYITCEYGGGGVLGQDEVQMAEGEIGRLSNLSHNAFMYFLYSCINRQTPVSDRFAEE